MWKGCCKKEFRKEDGRQSSFLGRYCVLIIVPYIFSNVGYVTLSVSKENGYGLFYLDLYLARNQLLEREYAVLIVVY